MIVQLQYEKEAMSEAMTVSNFAWVALLCLMVFYVGARAEGPAMELGYLTDTEVIGADGEICPGAVLQQHDDGDFENGYTWTFGGVVPPDYGSFAECYSADFVCAVEFLFTQSGFYTGQTMDVYVWDWLDEGDPPPGPDPGNVICMLAGVAPGPISFWPEISTHRVQVCCETGGDHFVGYWGEWPGEVERWFIVADENGPGGGCPRTKIAPGIGYPTGWVAVTVVPSFDDCRALGIREWAGLGDCQPTLVEQTTWGRIKALY
jgi:hypothetical protein